MVLSNLSGQLSLLMPTLQVNKKLEKLFTATQQIIVIIGGRGSGKSIGVGDILTFKMATEDADIYCLREFQDSVTDSVHRVFEDSIKKRLKLSGWDIQKNTVISPDGAKTTYKGANRNPDSMQSAQGYKYSWFEEAHRASQDSIDKLLPTILRNPGAKCIFTANPQSSADPFSQRFITPYLSELEANGIYEDIRFVWIFHPYIFKIPLFDFAGVNFLRFHYFLTEQLSNDSAVRHLCRDLSAFL